GYRRKQCNLVAVADRMVAPDIIPVDRDPDHRQVAQGLGVGAAALLQPPQQALDVAHLRRQRQILLGVADACAQPGEIEHLHANTSENGRNSTLIPGARSARLSSRMTNPSDCTIEERMPAPSLG